MISCKQGDQIGRNFAIWVIFYGKIFSRKNRPMIWAKFWSWKNCQTLTLKRLKFCSKRVFLHVSKIFKKLYLLFLCKKNIKECPVPLDISIKSNIKHHKTVLYSKSNKNMVGRLFGRFFFIFWQFFHKNIWSPWLQNTFR